MCDRLDPPRDGTGRRILLLTKTDHLRPRDGGSLRVAAIIRELEGRGFVVDAHAVRTSAPSGHSPGALVWRLGDVAAVLRTLLRFLRGRSLSALAWFRPGLIRDIRQNVSTRRYDATLLEFTQLLGYLPMLPRPVLLDMHNVESELMANYASSTPSRLKRLAGRYEASVLRGMEAAALRKVDAVATVSSRDAATLRARAPADRRADIIVASNGVDDAAFATAEPRRNTVVFVAHLGWRPNVDAAVWLVREVWPLVQAVAPHLVLQLVGRSPGPEVAGLAGPSVEVHADVPSVLPFVSAARVATAPLLAAGGTRLKILEALACGTPVVATPLGALGLEDLAGPSLRLAPSARDFARAVVDLAGEAPARAATRATVDRYRWRTVLEPLLDRIEQWSGPVVRQGSSGVSPDAVPGGDGA